MVDAKARPKSGNKLIMESPCDSVDVLSIPPSDTVEVLTIPPSFIKE